MGMSIEKSIENLVLLKKLEDSLGNISGNTNSVASQSLGCAIDTMRKYQQLQADYENRLKADMVAMLTEIQLEIEELYPKAKKAYRDGLTSYCEGVDDSREIIQQKINALKGEKS